MMPEYNIYILLISYQEYSETNVCSWAALLGCLRSCVTVRRHNFYLSIGYDVRTVQRGAAPQQTRPFYVPNEQQLTVGMGLALPSATSYKSCMVVTLLNRS